MATTLTLLKFSILPPKNKQQQPHIHPKLQIPSTNSNASQKLLNLNHILHGLKSASLPLTTLALPFFLNPKILSQLHSIHLTVDNCEADTVLASQYLTRSGQRRYDETDALAAGGEFGILEGRTFALIHPIVMTSLFLYTLYAGYLGWQWRRVRTIQEEINELKKQVKPVAVTPDGTPAEPPKPSPIEAKIQQLSEERKELIKGSYRDKHFNAGSILLGFGVFESIGGGVNTYLRTGKLFPGPHLYAGAAITVLWAAAAALVPPMQKGSETARNLHIALNVLNVLLFVWQIPTGLDIVFKVFEFTKWP